MRKIIRTDGTETDLEARQSLDKIRATIGADTLDTVLLRDRVHVMLVDDIGHQKQLPVNQKATNHYWERCGSPNDHYIRGDVVIVPDSDFGG
jgi:hypothetical protein